MKNSSTILSSIALIGVIILFVFHFNNKKTTISDDKTSTTASGSCKIAYVDIDTFEANYTYLKAKREEFNKKQAEMQSELDNSAQQYQSNVEAFQRKAQSGSISQAEGEATQKKLVQMQESLRLREQTLTEQLVKQKDEFNAKLHDELDNFLAEYNKDKGYDYIFSYSKSASQILFANKNFDITKDVIKGMNNRAKNMSDSTKKN